MRLNFHDDIFGDPRETLTRFLRLQFALGLTPIERKFAITFFRGLEANVPDLGDRTPGQRRALFHAEAQQYGHAPVDVPDSYPGHRPPRPRRGGRP